MSGRSGCGSLRLPLSSAAHRPITGAVFKSAVPNCGRDPRRACEALITVVSFNSYIFGGSVRSTLLEGRPDADESALQEVLRRVNLLDFVQSQGGLDMPLMDGRPTSRAGSGSVLLWPALYSRTARLYL